LELFFRLEEGEGLALARLKTELTFYCLPELGYDVSSVFFSSLFHYSLRSSAWHPISWQFSFLLLTLLAPTRYVNVALLFYAYAPCTNSLVSSSLNSCTHWFTKTFVHFIATLHNNNLTHAPIIFNLVRRYVVKSTLN